METSLKLVTGDSPVGLSKLPGRALTAHRLLSHFRAIYLLWESRLYEDVGAVSLIDSSGILTEELRLF